MVTIVLKLHISLHDGQNVEKFKDGLDNYISDNPEVWDSLVNFRCEEIDSDDEYVIYRIAVRSRHSWQVAARVLADRGRLHQFCTELAKKLGVNFDSPTARRVFYYGGSLVDGAVKDFKKNLLMDRNNISHGDFLGSSRDLHRDHPSNTSRGPTPNTNATIDPEVESPTFNTTADDLFLSLVQQSQL